MTTVSDVEFRGRILRASETLGLFFGANGNAFGRNTWGTSLMDIHDIETRKSQSSCSPIKKRGVCPSFLFPSYHGICTPVNLASALGTPPRPPHVNLITAMCVLVVGTSFIIAWILTGKSVASWLRSAFLSADFTV